jgi:nitrile hydratase accessory protein
MAGSAPSPADSAVAARELPAMRAELPGLPHDDAGPVFNAPWEAQAFAMALALHERGEFSWKEWAQTLADVIAEVRQRGEADTGEHYYRHWQTALERIAARKGLVSDALLLQRRRQWDEAARRTPHGQPIELDP